MTHERGDEDAPRVARADDSDPPLALLLPALLALVPVAFPALGPDPPDVVKRLDVGRPAAEALDAHDREQRPEPEHGPERLVQAQDEDAALEDGRQREEPDRQRGQADEVRRARDKHEQLVRELRGGRKAGTEG